jgi:hypothetical protein
MTRVHLSRSLFGEHERVFLEADGVQVSLFRYATGVEAARIANTLGYVVVLPYLGQIVWDVSFQGVSLTMGSMFTAPRPATMILDTYGCYAYHSGLLRNGNPGPRDTHLPHGEMPCAPMDSATLEVGADIEGAFVRLAGAREYVRGFGAHYFAHPSVTLRPGSSLFDIGMRVRNAGGTAMDLMYMCHVNPAFVEDARIVQPAPWTPASVGVRTAIPPHVPATPEYRALLDELANDPARMEILDPALPFDPEQVFYIRDLRADVHGTTHLMLRRPDGDGFLISYRTQDFPYTVRWLMRNPDVSVAAFALPATCYPEGYTAEKQAGRVQSLAPGETREFQVRTGYLDSAAAAAMDHTIGSL